MPPNPCRDPFDDALDALVSGTATPRDRTILNDALRCDPAARHAYIDALAFEAMLAREFPQLDAADNPPPATREAAAPTPRRRWPALAALAATIALAATLALWPHRNLPPTTGLTDPEPEFTHAVVSQLDDATGRFGTAPLTQGQRLSGGTLELDHGLAEITFDTGAEMTLEGPARLDLESDHKARLAAGRASARIPEQARGFVILTPTSFIRDLGTTCALDVRDDRATDLHVLEGELEVAATGPRPGTPPQVLRQREAVRLAADGMVPIRFRPDHPAARPAKRPPKLPPSVHWAFDDWSGATTTATRGHSLRFLRGKEVVRPELLDGPFGRAVRFDGSGLFARSDYPGVGGADPRTVACWLRLDPAAPAASCTPQGIVAWGVNRSSGKWQVAWNTSQGEGTVGAPRVEFGDGFVIGSTDLRDGRWHHLAVVFLGGPKVNVASHVKLYVDGRLERLSGRRQKRIDTDTDSADARPLTLGRYLGPTHGRPPAAFTGDLDEVHVFEGALLPGQIVRLMKQNQLRPPKK